MQWTTKVFVLALPWGIACGVSVSGCKERKQERVYRQLRGTVRTIDVETGDVSMDFPRPSKGDIIELAGKVTQETEILINGRVAKLEDVRLEEEVEVTGYITGEGKDKRIIVTKVTIERPGPIEIPETGDSAKSRPSAETKPATKPASQRSG